MIDVAKIKSILSHTNHPLENISIREYSSKQEAQAKLYQLYCYMEMEDMHHKHVHIDNLSAENQVFLLKLTMKYLNELYSWLGRKGFSVIQTQLYRICDLPLKNSVEKISLWDYTMFWSGIKALLKQVEFPMSICAYSEKDFQILTKNIDAYLECIEENSQNDETDFILQLRLNYLNFMINSLKQEIEAAFQIELPDNETEMLEMIANPAKRLPIHDMRFMLLNYLIEKRKDFVTK
jgi:hypothetical protein